ncbi:DNA polymerase/3'-5' exonuclease PolX [Nguyenibacter sp. L1]|uniref:DNA polymerase/3'-5' exonuclease PolX n=1 Tax=Nguyenibacter sp. L1 TaxID=3049350 RepID=UPI002B491AA9|nr:DNA polymerase/3'-5' exonuclease PolX [Nguyenibacter sp. L1]WRH88993.1 DNA polymerase/3'-5' exonuclease PolX [Nguyenibacter sp. L1]
MPVQNAEIAAMFDQTADLLEIEGANQFRVRAYRRAARTIDGLPEAVTAMLEAGENLADLPGIGEDLAHKIADIVGSGRFALLDKLKAELPGELDALATLPGLGPKRVKILYDLLGVRSLDDLRRAVAAGHVHELPGFGDITERKLGEALGRPVGPRRFKLAVAEAEAQALTGYLGENGGRVAVAGSYRRRRDTIGDLDILASSAQAATAGDRLAAYENTAEILAHGPTRTTVVLRSGIQVDLRAVPEESYGAALLYFTGSKPHNIALRAIAARHGWKLNEYGLFAGERRIAGATEEEIYDRLGLAYIPPEMREDRGEIALAQAGRLPRLIALADMRGDLHVHSDWTDGTATIADMAAAARACGHRYMALTDHSRRVAMAHGLDPDRVARQGAEIDTLNAGLKGFTILKGIEVDILKDGTLDLPDTTLARLDIVVAAIHSFFDLPRDAQTARMLRAMENPHVSIIAHPTGRLLGERAPYAIDMDRVTSAARDLGCALEINAQPDRLDLNDAHAHMARSKGVKLAISTDAHSVNAFQYMRFGIDQARRAWLGPDDVLNTRPLAGLRALLGRRAARAA